MCVSGNKMIPLNVRIISTTNRNLKGKVAEGQFGIALLFRTFIDKYEYKLDEESEKILQDG